MNAKIIGLLFLFTFFFAGIQTVSAQKELSKQEEKKWKDAAKTYVKNPAGLKKLTEEHSDYKKQVKDLEGQVATIQSQLGAKDDRIADLESQIDGLYQELDAARASFEEFKQPEGDPDVIPMGTIFRVQIGAYAKKQVPGELETTPDMELETEDNLQKIVLGQFRTYEDAEKLRKYLRDMGVKDAWIVSYQDGKRVDIDVAKPPKSKSGKPN